MTAILDLSAIFESIQGKDVSYTQTGDRFLKKTAERRRDKTGLFVGAALNKAGTGAREQCDRRTVACADTRMKSTEESAIVRIEGESKGL